MKVKRDAIIVLAATLTFLLFQWLVVGLIPGHIIMAVLFNLLFFAHPITRKLAMTLLPFVFFEMCYDWMRLYPNYMVNPIDIKDIYDTELALFGITVDGVKITPCEYFILHNNAVADLFAGLFYLCWVPGPIALAIWLFFSGKSNYALRLTWAFLFVNLIGFCGYYVHPTAPPWYAIDFGFEPDFTTPGNVAGLGRFDELIGIPVFHSIYVNNSNIFAAMPSLHAAYMLVATIYAFISRQSRWLILTCVVITVGIWCTAIYTAHHYIIDVAFGILTAIVGVLLFELILKYCKPLRVGFGNYTEYVKY